MVKFIKPKPLSKREMKDLQRVMSPQPQVASPQMDVLSPIMPFPNSPFLDLDDSVFTGSPSATFETKARKHRSGTGKATKERLLPRARKSGGRHKPIAIPSNISPPRTPIAPSETDSGYVMSPLFVGCEAYSIPAGYRCESEFTSMINSAKKAIRQSADKMREDGLKLQKLQTSNILDSIDLDNTPATPKLSDNTPRVHQHFSPERKRRANLLRKKASGSPRISSSPSISLTGSSNSPVFSISFENHASSSSSFELVFQSSDSGPSQLATSIPQRPFRPVGSSRGLRGLAMDITDLNKGGPSGAPVTLNFRSLNAEEIAQYTAAGLGSSAARAARVLDFQIDPDPAVKESKEVIAEGTENHGAGKKKPRSKAKKKKKKRAGSHAPSAVGSPTLLASPVVEPVPALDVPSRVASPAPDRTHTPTIPLPKDDGITKAKICSPTPKAETPRVSSRKGPCISNVPSPVPSTTVRNRTPSSTPQPGFEKPQARRPPPTREEVKKVIEGRCAHLKVCNNISPQSVYIDLRAARRIADGLPQSKSSILRSYMTAMDSYRRVFDSSEAGGLALASSQSGKLADMLSNNAKSGGAGENDVDGIPKRPFGVAGEEGAAQKPGRMNDGQRSMLRPAGDRPGALAGSMGTVTETIADVDMEAGRGESSMEVEDAEGGLMVRDKRGALMRKVTSFVRSVTTAFLCPWRVLARAIEGSRCV